jgi:hypothetical protein
MQGRKLRAECREQSVAQTICGSPVELIYGVRGNVFDLSNRSLEFVAASALGSIYQVLACRKRGNLFSQGRGYELINRDSLLAREFLGLAVERRRQP